MRLDLTVPDSVARTRYVYEVCMFNKVEQRKITGGGNTRLGYAARVRAMCVPPVG